MTSDHKDVYGVFQYVEADNSVSANDRALYTLPSSRSIVNISQRLHNMRTSNEIVKDSQGLDIQGFTYLKHESALSGEDWFLGSNIEDVYVPEIINLVCKVTGAKRAVIDSIQFRRRLASEEEEQNIPRRKGDSFDEMASKLPKNTLRVVGRDAKNSIPPARMVHVDYSLKGLRDTVRFGRKDIYDVAKAAIDAEEEGKSPRYACYAVWRPLKEVNRDPLAVLDWRTMDRSELVPYVSRVLSGITPNGEYVRESLTHNPPKVAENHRWYWIPKQQSDEVLMIKFADTRMNYLDNKNTGIAACCAHAAVNLVSSENLPPRESIECRVMAFWE